MGSQGADLVLLGLWRFRRIVCIGIEPAIPCLFSGCVVADTELQFM